MRRSLRAAVLATALAFCPLASLSVGTPAHAEAAVATTAGAPNVLVVNLDDMRLDSLPFLAKTRARMQSGVSYPNFQVENPNCCPSRAGMLTGRYPHNNGVRTQNDGVYLPTETTFVNYLQDAGYRTAMTGKYLVPWDSNTPPPNFDDYSFMKGGYEEVWYLEAGRKVFRSVYRNGSTDPYTYNADGTKAWVNPQNYSPTYTASKLLGFLHGYEADDARPWLAYWAPQSPHTVDVDPSATTVNRGVPEPQYAAAATGECLQPDELDRSDKPPYIRSTTYQPAEYRALCQSQIRTLYTVDDMIEAMFRQLEADGELANTLVMITSDNGYLWGEHGRSSKFVPYAPATRVPLLVRWDGSGGRLPTGVDGRLAVNVDIAPTALDAAGVAVPAGMPAMDGQSLLRPSTRRDALVEYFYDTSDGPMPTWAEVWNGTRRYIETYDSTGARTFREYYDTVRDPAENENVLADSVTGNEPSATELAALASRLAALRQCSGADCYDGDTAPPPNSAPVARASASCSALACTFDGSNSSDVDGAVTAHAWSFGDGTTGSGATAAHTYAAAGTYPVTLTVTDDDGATASTTISVTVSATAAPIAFRAAAGTNTNTATPQVVVPAAVRAGDALVLVATSGTAASQTAPAGWSQVTSRSQGTVLTTVWQRVAGAADAGSTVRVQLSSLTKVDLRVLAYSGTAAASPVYAWATTAESTLSTAHPTASVSVATAGSRVVSYWADKSSTTTSWTAPAGLTVRSTAIGTGSGYISTLVADPDRPADPGTVPGSTATTNSASKATTVVLVLAPAG